MDGMSRDQVAEVETTRTTDRTSDRRGRVEVITRAEPRRSWTIEQKRRIVAESLGPDLTPTEVAHKYCISSGLLYTWRQQLVNQSACVVTRAPMQFAAVELAPAAAAAALSSPPLSQTSTPAVPASSVKADGLIEIVLPSGVSLRVDAYVDGHALRRVLGALEDR
jgi:transposase